MRRSDWKRWLSIATGIVGAVGFVLVGASEIFGVIALDQWGRLLGLIVQAMCIFFSVNAGIKIMKGED